MAERKPAQNPAYQPSGYPLGGRQRTGHPDGWHPQREESGPRQPLPPRGTTGSNNTVFDLVGSTR